MHYKYTLIGISLPIAFVSLSSVATASNCHLTLSLSALALVRDKETNAKEILINFNSDCVAFN